MRPLLKNMLNSDEPDHRRLRNLVQLAFTPSIVANLAPRIEQIARKHLNDLADQFAHDGQADLVATFALPLPIAVICELVGIPPQDRDKVTAMTDRLLSSFSLFGAIRAVPAIRRFTRYVRQLATERRKNPQDDLMSALVAVEADGEQLTEDELVGMTFLLTVAGHETTVGLITNAVLALIQYPEQRQRLLDDAKFDR